MKRTRAKTASYNIKICKSDDHTRTVCNYFVAAGTFVKHVLSLNAARNIKDLSSRMYVWHGALCQQMNAAKPLIEIQFCWCNQKD